MKTKSKNVTKTQKILNMLSKRPELSPKEVAAKLGVTVNLVHQVRWQKKKNKPSNSVAKIREVPKVGDVIGGLKLTSVGKNKFRFVRIAPDMVNSPPHYKTGGIETIDFIEAKDLNYRLGNVVKYVSRAGRKVDSDPIQDLEKALFYLKREISVRKGA